MSCPRMLEPECHTPKQMRLANAFCRYLELAQGSDRIKVVGRNFPCLKAAGGQVRSSCGVASG